MSPRNDLETQERVVETRLAAAAKLLAEGKLSDAERLYKQTLAQAEAVAGEDSAVAGLVVCDLMDFYEKQGRHAEAKPLWQQIRKILIAHLKELAQVGYTYRQLAPRDCMTGKDTCRDSCALCLLLHEAASVANRGDAALAETLYKQALRKAEAETENGRGGVRQVLLATAAFYDSLERAEEAEELRNRAESV